MSTLVIINPGSGPVANASENLAIENMAHFVTDCGVDLRIIRMQEDDEDGRFAFLLWRYDSTRAHHVLMPGLPLAKVRYMDEPGQNIWDFPRLYVDGSSWVWEFGLLKASDFDDPGPE